ncbi:MAG: hypothetical protein IRZ33_10580 [Alicyclobacillaceae bacterium]|nr:hypothetical protein [Alicyclobacillaceae bacterium]
MAARDTSSEAVASAEAGAATLFTVLSFALCAVLLSGIALYGGSQAATVASLHASQREAYWLARGQAQTDLADLQSGVLEAGVYNHVYANGSTQTVVVQGPQWTVKVTARTESSVDVITFARECDSMW